MSDEDPENLLTEAKEQDRLNSDPVAPADDVEDDPKDLRGAIQDAYEAIDEGEKNENITVRDTNLAALFAGLEEAGRLSDLAADAEEALGRGDSPVSQSQTLGLLARVGIQELDRELMEEASNAYTDHLVSSKDDF